MSTNTPEPTPLARLIHAYENLSPATLPALLALYDEQARFTDPFQDVQGRAAIGRVMGHMFETLIEPRFVVRDRIGQGQQSFLSWEFHFRTRATAPAWCIVGATHVHWTDSGLVQVHRDYWDAAQELYAKLPMLGALMRLLRRRLAAPQA
jgi:hypothetical protein